MTTTMTQQQAINVLLQTIEFTGSLYIAEMQQAVHIQVNQLAESSGELYPTAPPPPGPNNLEPFGGYSRGRHREGNPLVNLTLLAAFIAALHAAVPQNEITKPEEFHGNVQKACNFIHQGKMYFLSRRNKFVLDDQKIRFMTSLMKNSSNRQPHTWSIVQEKLYQVQGWPT